MEILNKNGPLVPSGIFQKDIVFPNISNGRLSHFHISSPSFLFTFSFPNLEQLQVIACSKDIKILKIQRVLNNYMVVVYDDLTIELRSLDSIEQIVRKWTFENLKTKFLNVDLRIENNHELFIYTIGKSFSNNEKNMWHLYQAKIDLLKDNLSSKPIKRILSTKNEDSRNLIYGIAVNHDATVVCVLTRPFIYFIILKKSNKFPSVQSVEKVGNSDDPTTVVYISSLDAFVVGYKLGEISAFTRDGRATTTHFHSGKIGNISLMQKEYIMTCSEDGFIVISHVEKIGLNPKKYQIGHSLVYAIPTSNHQFIAISRSNRIFVIDPTAYKKQMKGEIVSEFQGVVSPLNKNNFGIIALQKYKDRVATIGTSNIQIYNIKTGKQEQFIELHDQVPDINTFSRSQVDINIEKLETTSITFSKNDKLMASSELMGGLSNIKIWKYLGSGYKLINFIDTPHEGSVNHMIFSSDSSSLISLGKDNTIKVWDLTGDKPICKKITSLQDKKPYRVALSPDGSVVVIAFQNRLGLYETNSFELLRYLSTLGKECSEIAFLNESTLVYQCTNYIQAISLKDLSSLWKFQFSEEYVKIVVNPYAENEFAIVTTTEDSYTSRIFFVDTRDNTPRTISYKFNGNAKSIAFVDEFKLVVLTTDLIFITFLISRDAEEGRIISKELIQDKLDYIESSFSNQTKLQVSLEEKESKFDTIIRKEMNENNENNNGGLFDKDLSFINQRRASDLLKRHAFDPNRGKDLWKPLFEAPSHALPSCSNMFSTFVDSFLIRKDSQFGDFEQLMQNRNKQTDSNLMEDILESNYASSFSTKIIIQNNGYSQLKNDQILSENEPVFIIKKGKPILLNSGNLSQKKIENISIEIQNMKSSLIKALQDK